MAVYGNNELFTIYTHDGSTKEKAAPSLNHLVEIGISTNGFYWVNPSLGSTTPIYIYVNFTYRTKEAWGLVLSNRINTTGVANSNYSIDGVNGVTAQSSVTYDKAVNFVNYKGSYGNTNLDFNCMIGAKYWKLLGRNVCQFVSSSAVPISSTGSHNKRYRWAFSDMNSQYGFQNAYAISDETGTGAPGFYGYHAANGFGLTTYDNDVDTNGGNCSTYYNNAPNWYGGCWDGNPWGGMGAGNYADAYFWSGSGGDYYNYGAIYIGG
jgi:hypothetical protein